MYDSVQICLINVLKKILFLLKGDGIYKVVLCFLSLFNELMFVMCEDYLKFLFKLFCFLDWKMFMILVGMKIEIIIDLFLEFVIY